ncbi:hypothetical protein [Hyella patelloides]|uniref:hypothetical protein n=1 Tax=Hyella patelloides TaxID=1982969 RepID=UPI0016439D2D|nr:hypothetical protein [Hyella patelloides]
MLELTTGEELIDSITNNSLLATIGNSTTSVILQGTTSNNHNCLIEFTTKERSLHLY